MLYAVLAKTYEALEATSKRLEMTDILVGLFKQTPADILDKVIFLTQGKLHPSWLGQAVIGIAEKSAIKAVAQALNNNEQTVNQAVKEYGDLGSAFEKLLKKKSSTSLDRFFNEKLTQSRRFSSPVLVVEVYSELDAIAKLEGPGSADTKVNRLARLLSEVTKNEAKWILRTVIGKLRFGVQDMTIIDALAIAFTGNKNKKQIIERGYNIHPNLGEIAKILASNGIDAIERKNIEVLTPVRMMLAQRLSAVEQVLDKLGGKCACEYKYDGERIQAHKSDSIIKLFSRNLENLSDQYPDVCQLIQGIQIEKCVLEGECVAIDHKTGNLRPFQELMHRRRKYDIDEAIQKYPVCLFLFDILKFGEKDLISTPYLERRRILENLVNETDRLKLATSIISDDNSEIESFFEDAIQSGCEGIIAKSIQKESGYQAGARGWLWIKLKQSYQSKMVDSIDVVILGGYFGRGRRAQTYGAVLCGVLNKDQGTFQTICKLGSGFTDEHLSDLIQKFQRVERETKPPLVNSLIKPEPDIWFEPNIVAEILGDEITISSVHSAGFGRIKPDSGLAIRFPRFIRWRADKSIDEITTADEIIDMYKQQTKQI
ncbi:MAG: ATP-dependent DNA ligase [Promethearchaeota archaeon]|nr:MAG: ATP-dependent DNA ligase [Candidatus Lokiarchaeota archaeon]